MTPTLTDLESLASSSFLKTLDLVGISLILNPIVVFSVDLLIGWFFLISYRLATILTSPILPSVRVGFGVAWGCVASGNGCGVQLQEICVDQPRRRPPRGR